MRNTFSCARGVLSLSVAAALGAPLMAMAGPPVIADGAAMDLAGDSVAGTSGQNGAHALSAINGGTINATDMVLSADGVAAAGAHAKGAGSLVNLADSTVSTTTGTTGSALQAVSGGRIVATGVVVTTGATNSKGVQAEGGSVDFRGGSIRTSAFEADGVRVMEGGVVNIGRDDDGNGTVIETTGDAWGLSVGAYLSRDGAANVDGATLRSLAGGGASVIGSAAVLQMSDSSIESALVGVRAREASHSTLQNVVIRSGQMGRLGGTGVLVQDGAHVDLVDTSITTAGNQSHGIHAETGGTATANNTDIVTTGVDAYGVLVDGTGSRVEFLGGSINTSGTLADGVKVTNGGSALVDGAVITTPFTSNVGAYRGSQLDVRNSTLHNVGSQAQNAPSHGVDSRDAGTIVTVSDSMITMEGRGGSGLFANGGGVLSANRTRVHTTGDQGHGVLMGPGSTVSLLDSELLTDGQFASGANVTGGQLTSDGSTLSTTGWGANALQVTGAQSAATILDSALTTLGKDAHAAWADAGGKIDIVSSQLSSAGAAARGVNATKGSQASIADSTIHTNSGALTDAHGVYANEASSVSATNVQITIEGNRSRGLLADAATISAEDVSIVTSGSQSNGVLGINGATLALDGVSIITRGQSGHGVANLSGSQLVLDGAAVETLGENAFGVIVRNDGSHADLTGLQVTTRGGNSIGLSVDYGTASATLADSQIITEGSTSHAVRVDRGATLDISNSLLKSQSASALLLDNGVLTATDGTAIEGNGTLAEFGSDAANVLNFDRNVVALGDIRFADGASDLDGNARLDRTSSLSLDHESYWKGATDALGDLSLAGGSRWDVTGNSEVGTLALSDASIVFDHADGQYKTLTVDGNFHADNGLLAMNTALGDDTSPTDLLHVMGDTSGNAQIAVNNIGGTGAQTQDGIKLVQVDGASAGEYALSGRAVGGAYEYFLFQGGRTDPTDGDWYLRSELPVDPVNPVDPVDPVDPIDPVDPVNPVDPIDPVIPIDPISPIDPIDPVGPPQPTPVYRPEGGAYLANQASALGMFNLDLHERVGEPGLAQRQRGSGNLGGAWARITTEQPRYRVNEQLTGQGRHNVIQAGTDLTFWGQQDRGVVGVMASSGQATNRVTSELTGYGAEGRVDGRAIGVYSTWMKGAEEDDGLYIDGWLQAAHFKNRVQGDGLAREHYRARSLSASVEAGYAVRLHQNANSALYLEPEVQAIWTDYRMQDGSHEEVNGTVVKVDQAGGVQTRVGARLYGHSTSATGNRVQPFVAVNWVHNGGDANAVWLGEQSLQGIVPKNVYEAKAGAQLQLSPRLTGWGELNTQRGEYGFRSVGGQLGVKYAW